MPAPPITRRKVCCVSDVARPFFAVPIKTLYGCQHVLNCHASPTSTFGTGCVKKLSYVQAMVDKAAFARSLCCRGLSILCAFNDFGHPEQSLWTRLSLSLFQIDAFLHVIMTLTESAAKVDSAMHLHGNLRDKQVSIRSRHAFRGVENFAFLTQPENGQVCGVGEEGK